MYVDVKLGFVYGVIDGFIYLFYGYFILINVNCCSGRLIKVIC